MGDLPGLDRRLDPVALPDLLELGQRAGEEPPRVEHPVELGIGPHVLERDRRGIGVNPQQLDLRARLAEHRLGIQHRRGRQRAHRGALGVVESEDHDLAAERVQRDVLPELIRQREIGSHARHRRTRIQIGIRGQRLRLRRRRPVRPHHDDHEPGHRDEEQHSTRNRQPPTPRGRAEPPSPREPRPMPAPPPGEPVDGERDSGDRQQSQRDDPQHLIDPARLPWTLGGAPARPSRRGRRPGRAAQRRTASRRRPSPACPLPPRSR